jgi:hypothetical protein
MIEPPSEIKLRLLFVLHRGLVEVRLLSAAGKADQVFDLADALELIPGMIKNWKDGDLDRVRDLSRVYQSKYPTGGFDFIARLDDASPLPF